MTNPNAALAAVAAVQRALWPATNRVLMLGDSITHYYTYTGTNEVGNGLSGYMTQLNWLSGQAFNVVYEKGVNGNTTSQMVARFASDVQANYAGFDTMFLLGGTNDLIYGQAGPTANWPRTITKETTLANLQFMVGDALAHGKKVVLILTMPRVGTGWNPITDTTSQTRLWQEARWVNRQLVLWRQSLGGTLPFFIVDATREFADPTSTAGMAYSPVLGDGLHPNGIGAWYLARRIWETIGPYFVPPIPAWASTDDPYDATYNPWGNVMGSTSFRTTSGGTASNVAGTVPNGWNVSRSTSGFNSEVTVGTSAFAAGYGSSPGNALTLAVAMASGHASNEIVQIQGPNITAGIAAGQQFVAQCELNWTGGSNINYPALILQAYDGTTNYYASDGKPANGYGVGSAAPGSPIMLRTRPLTLPAGVTKIYMILQLAFAANAASAGGNFTVQGCNVRRVG